MLCRETGLVILAGAPADIARCDHDLHGSRFETLQEKKAIRRRSFYDLINPLEERPYAEPAVSLETRLVIASRFLRSGDRGIVEGE